MKNFSRLLFVVTIVTTALSACGGGGGGSSSNDAPGQAAVITAVTQMGGTYILPCRGETFDGYTVSDGTTSESETATIIITPDLATGKAGISACLKYYRNSPNCDEAMLDADITFLGAASDKVGRKNYTNAAGKPVTANVSTVTYSGIRLAKGNLEFSLPTLGASTDMAYVFENNTLYLSKGNREADGLGDALTPGAVKQ